MCGYFFDRDGTKCVSCGVAIASRPDLTSEVQISDIRSTATNSIGEPYLQRALRIEEPTSERPRRLEPRDWASGALKFVITMQWVVAGLTAILLGFVRNVGFILFGFLIPLSGEVITTQDKTVFLQ